MGLPMNEDNFQYTVCFADDHIAQDYKNVNCMTRNLMDEYTKQDLEVKLNKTEYMCIGGYKQELGNDQHVKRCTDCKYLGLKIARNEAIREQICRCGKLLQC